jgi:putative phage-type endonuclease
MLTEQEQEIRRTGVGASETPAIIGESPYATAWKVWLQKTGRAPSETTERSQAGHGLEEWIARTAAARIDGFVSMRKGTTHAHPLHPCVLATPDYELVIEDALATYDALLECKAVGFRVRHHWDDGVPTYVEAQVQQQMEVRDRERCFVAAHLDGTSVELYTVERDRAVGAWLVEQATRFWEDHVLADVPPPIDGSPAAGKWLRTRLKAGTEKRVDPRSMLAGALDELRYASQRFREWKAKREQATQEVLALSDGATRLLVPEGDRVETVQIATVRGKVRWSDAAQDLSKQLGLTKAEAEELANSYRGDASVRMRLPKAWGAEENDE